MKSMTLVYIAIVLIIGSGWIMNIVEIVGSDFGNITGMLVIRCVGIFVPPLGGVMGYL